MSKLDEPGQGEYRLAQPVSWVAYPPEDEISLIDIWRALLRRRWWIVITIIIFATAGLAYALLVPPDYEYTTVINVGTRMVSGENTQPLTSPDALSALATNAIIPVILRDYAIRHSTDDHYEIEATHPSGSNLLVLSTKGPLTKRSTFNTLQQQIAHKLITIPMHRVETLHQQLNEEIRTIQSRIKSLQEILEQLRDNSNSQANNNTTLNLQRSQTKIDLAEAQSDLANQHLKLAALIPPKLTATDVRSQNPVSPSGKLIVFLAVISGLFFGAIIALFIDFAHQANKINT